MATLLLFNIEDEAKRRAIMLLSVRLGYTFRDILPEQQGRTIADLLADTGASGHAHMPFTDEMMVMAGFAPQQMRSLVDGMRSNGCPVKLKCIVTDTNRAWTAEKLHSELSAEDQAFRNHTAKSRRP